MTIESLGRAVLADKLSSSQLQDLRDDVDRMMAAGICVRCTASILVGLFEIYSTRIELERYFKTDSYAIPLRWDIAATLERRRQSGIVSALPVDVCAICRPIREIRVVDVNRPRAATGELDKAAVLVACCDTISV